MFSLIAIFFIIYPVNDILKIFDIIQLAFPIFLSATYEYVDV